MFLFLKLVLAHLIADFILQFEELYQLKVRSLWGHILHVVIHGIVSIVMVYPYLDQLFMGCFLGGLVLLHLLQDFVKYTLTKKIPKNTFLYFIGDQFVHLIVISTILLFPISNEIRGFPVAGILNRVYLDYPLTLFFIFSILLTFAGNYTFHAFYKSYVENSRPLCWITSPEIAYAILERGVIASAVIFAAKPHWVFVSLLIGVLRLPFPNLRNLRDFLLSAMYTVALSDIFLLLLP
ncbi:MAG TPA: DUF3307 domain-containing protein [Candidatus Omnitrophota bacterium]|mgnify:CR=1 FL=1|nr:DUF3307 domain-containing protein [Candidatus Omnitrophota bacterium]HPS36399.1 DUF3307 domain-containing protein [Candidatus Omnitrophota bacterium]